MQLASFVAMRDSYFDVSAGDAIEVIEADSKKSKDARAEDVEFIRRLRRNEVVSFGKRDWDQQKRFERAAIRMEERNERQKKEEQRKLVMRLFFYLIQSFNDP